MARGRSQCAPGTARWEGEGQDGGKKLGKKSKMRIIQSVSPVLCSHFLFFSNFSPVFISTETDLELLPQISAGTSLSFVLGCTSPSPCSSLPAQPEISHSVCFTQFPWDQGVSGSATPQLSQTPALTNNVLFTLGPLLSIDDKMISHTNVSN